MVRPVLLNNVDHQDLRVITRRERGLGDDVMYAIAFPGEFRNLQAHYPIFFHKDQAGEFHPVAMFGFEEGENLFLSDEGWDAAYLPLTIQRQPFLIGFQGAASGGEGERSMVIHVDMDSPRVSTTQGEAVFLEHGGVSEYLERMNYVLGAIHAGLEANKAFVATLLEHELLESFTLDVELNDGSEHRLLGFYAVHEEKLAQLSAEALYTLNQAGYLSAIYMSIASLSNIRQLIDRRNARLPGTAG